MPNGISCAYFALKNYEYGKQNNDIFRDGVACAQTARTADTVVRGVNASSPVANTMKKIAGFAKKIVYPLIILSGVYNTVKSDDKVKTGSEQAFGISLMYTFEQIAEKGMKSAQKYLKGSVNIPNNKVVKPVLYIAKGAAFVAASMSGYTLGKNIGGNIVDKARENKKNPSSNAAAPEVSGAKSVYDDFAKFSPS